jgi:hypothetical protein
VATLFTAPDSLDFQSQVSTTATTYVWTSSTGHRITAADNFTYPGGVPTGTVTDVAIDLGSDADTDIVISAITNADLATILISFEDFYAATLSGADTFSISADRSSALVGDYRTAVSGSIGGDDIFAGTSNGGEMELYGDH